jgi:intein/homing endonuclease
LAGLRAWSYEYDDKSKIFSSIPKHDWACLVGESLVKTQGGNVRIDRVRVGELVETPMGYFPVLELHEYLSNELIEITLADGRKVTCTHNHKWFTTTGLVYSDELCCNDVLFSGYEISWKLISLISTVAGITDIHRAITDLHQQGSKEKKELKQERIIVTYGSFITESYLKGAKYIIKMKTKAITALITLNALLGQNIRHCMGHQAEESLQDGIEQKMEKSFIASKVKRIGKMTGREVLSELKKLLNLEGIRRQNGTKARPVKNGTESKVSRHGKIERFIRKIALFAIKNLLQLGRIEAITVGRIVELKLIDLEQKVYDLTVQDHHMYKANGILSSNSHDGDGFSYGCLIMQQFNPPIPEDNAPKFWEQQTLNELWNENRLDRRI